MSKKEHVAVCENMGEVGGHYLKENDPAGYRRKLKYFDVESKIANS